MTTIEREVVELKARVAQLEREVRRLSGDEPARSEAAPGEALTMAEVLARLKAEGVIADLPPEARDVAARWWALSEAEKEAHIRFMRSLKLDPPLSQIIIESRR